MGLVQSRGGFPQVWQGTVGTTGAFTRPKGQTSHIQVMAVTNPVRVYFREDDFNADVNFILVPVAAATHPWGWEGPAELGALPVHKIWFRGVGGNSDVTAVFYLRKA